MKMYRLIKRSFVVLFLIFGIIGCKKTNDNIEFQNSNLSNKIGFYHNEILKNYFTTPKNNLKSSVLFNYQNVKEDVINILVSIDSKRFNRNELESSLKKSDKILDSLGIVQMFNLKSTTASNKNNYFTKLINYLYSSHKISLDLMDSLGKINELTISKPEEIQEILSEVKNLKNKKWGKEDSKFVDAFTQVYESSNSYWTQKRAGLKSTDNVEGGDETSGVILADAAGALYGLLGSPVVSILEGATFSLIAHANYISNQ